MTHDTTPLEIDATELASLYDGYLAERELALVCSSDSSLPEFYTPAPSPLTLVVRD